MSVDKAKSRAGGRFLRYELEFYVTDEKGERRRLRGEQREGSIDFAIRHAKSILKYALIEDQKPDVCIVKDRGGKVVRLVVLDELAASPSCQHAREAINL